MDFDVHSFGKFCNDEASFFSGHGFLFVIFDDIDRFLKLITLFSKFKCFESEVFQFCFDVVLNR